MGRIINIKKPGFYKPDPNDPVTYRSEPSAVESLIRPRDEAEITPPPLEEETKPDESKLFSGIKGALSANKGIPALPAEKPYSPHHDLVGLFKQLHEQGNPSQNQMRDIVKQSKQHPEFTEDDRDELIDTLRGSYGFQD